ncbi:MAG: DNA double-strand break repair nuclease NurA, partial [Chloroflexi bacterium]|nr:DNA double-strand break repair nuclease NurA [Chloroflexota bacterium]
LFQTLRPGERSAVFDSASPPNREHYKPRSHSIHFFYLNAGQSGNESILRVEVPEWVAGEPRLLDLAHSAIVEQCRVTGGFSYVLMRAHELAVVTGAERGEFDQMIAGAMIRRGITPRISQKAMGKLWTGGKR